MIVTIIIGLPGSGKSRMAREAANGSATICSTDEFFVDCEGDYKFVPALLSNAHDWCRKRVEDAMINRDGLIILDNTNTQFWEFTDYVLLARKYNYHVETQVVGGLSVSDVDKYAIQNISHYSVYIDFHRNLYTIRLYDFLNTKNK